MKNHLQSPLLRLILACAIVITLVVVSTSVWAAPVFRGTVPEPPATGESTDSEVVDMGTALFEPDCNGCTIEVALVDDPSELAPAPEGKAFYGDAFDLQITGEGSVKITFAYPPEFAGKNAKIFRLDTSVTPPVWVEVPSIVNPDGTISANVSESGVYVLVGDQ